MDDESGPAPLHSRRSSDKRGGGIMRWSSDISAGTLLLAIELAAGGITGYTIFVSEREHSKMELEQVKGSVEANRVTARETISAINTKMDRVQDTLNSVAVDVAVLKAHKESK